MSLPTIKAPPRHYPWLCVEEVRLCNALANY